MSSFASFQISKPLAEALNKLGYVSPSPVQSRVIPKALSGKSLVCQSETGSGKTHAYLVPILERIDMNLPRLQAIVLAPSRELARQVYAFASELGKFFPRFKVRLFTSETEKKQNEEGLTQAPQLIVATPGRAKDLLVTSSLLPLYGVRTLVLDEADMLLELGYFEDIDALYSALPENVQTMVFSATFSKSLKAKIERYVSAQFLYEGEENKTASTVSHHLVDIRHDGVLPALDAFLKLRHPYLALVFASKKEKVNEAYGYLKSHGYEVLAFSGDLDARERKKTMRLIQSNKFPVIVASDLLSRGIDLEDVTDVISLDLPSDLSYYYHRAGRSGRFGKRGDSWVFYNADDTRREKALIAQGVAFDYLTLRGEELVPSSGSLFQKPRPAFRHEVDLDQARDIAIAKAKTKSDRVYPGYKAKQKKAVEQVKRKYRRKAIQKKVQENKDRAYAARAKNKKK